MTGGEVVDRMRACLLQKPLEGETVDTDAQAETSASGAPGAYRLTGYVSRAQVKIAKELFEAGAAEYLLPLIETEEGTTPLTIPNVIGVLPTEVFRASADLGGVPSGFKRCWRRERTRHEKMRRQRPGTNLFPVYTLDDGRLTTDPVGDVQYRVVRVPGDIDETKYRTEVLALDDRLFSAVQYAALAAFCIDEGDERASLYAARYEMEMAPLLAGFVED